MANYNELYYSTWGDLTKDRMKLTIEQLDYTGSTQRVYMAKAPVITYPEIKKGYDWLFSSGIEFELLATYDRQFANMFTNQIMKYRITLYHYNPAYVSYYPVWQGFIDSETYFESANEKINYNVKFTGSDGFKLLERFKYVDSNNAHYSGMTNFYNVIKNCLSKINYNGDISWLYVSCNKSTSVTGLTGATYNPLEDYSQLEKFFIQNENYYDEDNEAMDCLTVFKSVLDSFQLYAFQDCTTCLFYLIDDFNYRLTGTTRTFYQVYNMNDYTMYDKVTEPTYNTDINGNNPNFYNIKIDDTDGVYEIQTGIKTQKLNYSQYASNDVIEWNTKGEQFGDLSTIVQYAAGSSGYKWQEFRYNNHTYFDKLSIGSFVKYQGNGTENYNITDYYIKLNEGEFGDVTPANTFTLNYALPYINYDNRYYLKIELDSFFRTTDTTNQTPLDIRNARNVMKINVGNKRYRNTHTGGVTGEWTNSYQESDGVFINYFIDSDRSGSISDTWMTNKSDINSLEYNDFLMIPLNSALSGDLQIILTNYLYAWNGNVNVPANQKQHLIKDVRFKRFKITICDENGEVVELKDKEYEILIDDKYASKGDSIKLINGTNIDLLPISRGAIYENNGSKYVNINKIYNSRVIYNQLTDSFDYLTPQNYDILENLNLKNIIEQYETHRIMLSFTTTLTPLMFSRFSYSSQYPNKQFMLVGLENDYDNRQSKIKLIEYDNN